MSSLTYNDKSRMAYLFDFHDGFIFTFDKNYNKSNTRDMIFEATGIDINTDPDYQLSQEKCVRKVWDECEDNKVGKLINIMLQHYFDHVPYTPDEKDQRIYCELSELANRIINKPSVELPDIDGVDLSLIKEDIEQQIVAGNPELCIDRLHTYATAFFRRLCEKHGIDTKKADGDEQPLHSIAGLLKNWYIEKDYFSSEFFTAALQYSVNTFQKYNDLRNKRSAAHPSELLDKKDAEYAVKIIMDTLVFIEAAEKKKDGEIQDELPF